MKKLFTSLLLLVLAIQALYASEEVPTKEEVAKLYVATFNRAPDAEGLKYWVEDSGLRLSEIAKSFFDQSETKELYPPNSTNEDFVKAVYNNLFNRDPESLGLDYWKNELDLGIGTKDKFLMSVINGAQDNLDGNDAIILENKTQVGLEFVNSGLNDMDKAKDVLSNVTDNTYTVDYSKGIIDILSDNTNFSTSLKESDISNKNFTVFDIYDDKKITFEFYSDNTALIKNTYNTTNGYWKINNDSVSVTDDSNVEIYDVKFEDDIKNGSVISVNDTKYVAEAISDVLYNDSYIKHTTEILSLSLTNDGSNIIFGDTKGVIYKYSPITKKTQILFNVNMFINSIELVGDILYIGNMYKKEIQKYSYPNGEYLGVEESITFPDGLGVKDSMLYSMQNDKSGVLRLIDINSDKRYTLNTTVPDPVGITYHNNSLYILDESGDIYRYNFTNTNVSKIFTNTKFNTTSDARSTGLEGITILDGKIWVSFVNDGNLYELNVELPSDEVVVDDNEKDSLDTKQNIPTFDKEVKTYTLDNELETIDITISSDLSSSEIIYTTDGTTPTLTNGQRLFNPIVTLAKGTTTIKAVSVDKDDVLSDVATAIYTLNYTPNKNNSFTKVVTDDVEDIADFSSVVDLKTVSVDIDESNIKIELALDGTLDKLIYNGKDLSVNVREYDWDILFDLDGNGVHSENDIIFSISRYKSDETADEKTDSLLNFTQKNIWLASSNGASVVADIAKYITVVDNKITFNIPKSVYSELSKISSPVSLIVSTSYNNGITNFTDKVIIDYNE